MHLDAYAKFYLGHILMM